MEFWGVEVKAGVPLMVKPEDGRVIHISQAALGEAKKEKGNDIVPLRLKINGKMFVVGSLSGEKFPQVSFDLVLEKEFELSHDWKNGSVYFCGYSAENPYEDDEGGFDTDEDEDEDLPLPTGITGNGTIEAKIEAPTSTKAKAGKPESSAKPKVTVVNQKKMTILMKMNLMTMRMTRMMTRT
jgi:nucleophosmin 1